MPPILMLDEPTDHLDFVGMAAMQAALRAWAGGLCLVSHDEEFLQSIGVQRRIALGDEARKIPAWRDDPDAIAHEMAEALRGTYDGWETVTAGEVAVADHSGPTQTKRKTFGSRSQKPATSRSLRRSSSEGSRR